jgi:hypothetical protein
VDSDGPESINKLHKKFLLEEAESMSKAECKMKLKHQLEIGRKLQNVGLYEAAAESRNKAEILLQTYKRHFPVRTG